MQVKKTSSDDMHAVFMVVASENELNSLKEHVLSHFQDRVKVPGFRAGKIPPSVLEKNVDQDSLQGHFLEEAIEQMYAQAANELNLRPVDQPKISIKKFVPFSTLEFEVDVAVVGDIKLPDYKKIKKARPSVTITDKDINSVIDSLKTRLADKKDVDRAAQSNDQLWIDFEGVDASGKPVTGADGKNYPLMLGSNTFIPGFEDNLIGLKTGEEKSFTLTFPKDYGVKTLANKKVTFNTSVIKVQEVVEPKLDNDFAKKAGPFETVQQLKADIKKQLTHEKKHEADRQYENELVREIASKSKVNVPDILVDEQIERMEQDERQNLAYRGQTWEEHLKEEGVTAEQHREQNRVTADERVKMSLVLSEIAELEKLEVTPEELEIRLQILKGQYKDPQMLAELDKPEARRDVASRILTEKTVQKLVNYSHR